MSGPIPVFVQAEEPAVREALVDALVRQGDVAAVDRAEAASWIVVTGRSEAHGGDSGTVPRVVAFVTSTGALRSCHVVGPALAALATDQPGAPGWPTLPRPAVTRLGSALVRTAGRPSELTPREEAVLRLVAQGHTTAEVAAELAYSERSIKNVIRGVTERLALRNRCHVVAHAVREGWI
jgi:DNA-binding CsgD family transcriptional regulator